MHRLEDKGEFLTGCPECGMQPPNCECEDSDGSPAPREQPHELRDAAFKHSITATHQLAALESENMKLRESLSSETVPTPASPAATPRTDRFALEKMFQASAGVLTEDDAIEQLLNFARTLERENADLQMRLARKAEQAADLESQCANLRRDLEQADSVCDAALRSLPSATGAMPKAFYEIVEVANTEGMPDSTPLPIWPKDVAWDFTPLTVGDIRAMLAAAPAPASATETTAEDWYKAASPYATPAALREALKSLPVEAGATRKWVAAYWRLTKNLNLGEVSDYDDELASDIRELRDEAEQILDGPYMKREQDAGECLSCVDGQCVSAEHCVTMGLDSPEPQREPSGSDTTREQA